MSEPFKTETYVLADGAGDTLHFQGRYFRILDCTGASKLDIGADDYSPHTVPVAVPIHVPSGFHKLRVENHSGGPVTVTLAVGEGFIGDDRLTFTGGVLSVDDNGGSITVDGSFDLASAFSVTQDTVGAAAASLVAANPSRKSVTIYNNSTDTIYLGDTSGVTTSNGFPVPKNTAYEERDHTAEIFAIGAVGSQNVRIMEV